MAVPARSGSIEPNNPATIYSTQKTPHIGAEVHGIDLAHPLPDRAFSRLLEFFHRHAVIFLRGQRISPEQFAAFSARFGELDIHHMTEHTLPHAPQVRVLSNVKKDGRSVGIARGGMHWHSDLSYKTVPAMATLLYAIDCPPEGADTQFADMCGAYDQLSDEIKTRIRGKRAVHDRNFRYSMLYPNRPPFTAEQLAKVPPVTHPLVRRHPATGKSALFVAKDLVSGIVGMEDAAARQLVDELEAFATRRELVYSHKWQVGDVLIWDNRCTLHRATPYDNKYDRTLYRTQVKGEVPVAA
jgi:taurine dioxygenase